MNVSEYLLSRLKSLGVDHVFGIPGDFILPFFQTMGESDVEHIAACNELNAGYAADGYARLKGLGAAGEFKEDRCVADVGLGHIHFRGRWSDVGVLGCAGGGEEGCRD